jgi:hypothetical protein
VPDWGSVFTDLQSHRPFTFRSTIGPITFDRNQSKVPDTGMSLLDKPERRSKTIHACTQKSALRLGVVSVTGSM